MNKLDYNFTRACLSMEKRAEAAEQFVYDPNPKDANGVPLVPWGGDYTPDAPVYGGVDDGWQPPVYDPVPQPEPEPVQAPAAPAGPTDLSGLTGVPNITWGGIGGYLSGVGNALIGRPTSPAQQAATTAANTPLVPQAQPGINPAAAPTPQAQPGINPAAAPTPQAPAVAPPPGLPPGGGVRAQFPTANVLTNYNRPAPLPPGGGVRDPNWSQRPAPQLPTQADIAHQKSVAMAQGIQDGQNGIRERGANSVTWQNGAQATTGSNGQKTLVSPYGSGSTGAPRTNGGGASVAETAQIKARQQQGIFPGANGTMQQFATGQPPKPVGAPSLPPAAQSQVDKTWASMPAPKGTLPVVGGRVQMPQAPAPKIPKPTTSFQSPTANGPIQVAKSFGPSPTTTRA